MNNMNKPVKIFVVLLFCLIAFICLSTFVQQKVLSWRHEEIVANPGRNVASHVTYVDADSKVVNGSKILDKGRRVLEHEVGKVLVRVKDDEDENSWTCLFDNSFVWIDFDSNETSRYAWIEPQDTWRRYKTRHIIEFTFRGERIELQPDTTLEQCEKNFGLSRAPLPTHYESDTTYDSLRIGDTGVMLEFRHGLFTRLFMR